MKNSIQTTRKIFSLANKNNEKIVQKLIKTRTKNTVTNIKFVSVIKTNARRLITDFNQSQKISENERK